MSELSPHALYKQTGGGDAYRVAMLEHGYTYPTPPWDRGKLPDKRVDHCGLTHDYNWTDWQTFREGEREYGGRWCRTCANTQAREIQEAPLRNPDLDDKETGE